MNAADMIMLFDIIAGIRITLASDGEHLRLVGPPAALEAAATVARLHKTELVEFLRAQHNPTAAR